MPKQKKVMVVGGAGFIGSNLVNKLIADGYEVRVLDNLSRGKIENVHPAAKLHVVDIRDLDGIRDLFSGIDTVFHLAALARVPYSIEHPIETNDVNILGTVSVLQAASQANVRRFVYSASSSAYGDQDKMPLTEKMIPNPKSPYGVQKLAGEQYAKVWHSVYGLETVSLRYFSVYGPGQNIGGAYSLVIGQFLKQRKDDMPLTLTGDGSQTRDFTHVSDVVRANIMAMKSDRVGAGEVINIGAGRNRSVKQIAELIGGEIEYIPARLEPHNTLADNSLARELLGWEPTVAIEDGLAELKKLTGLI